MEYNNWIDGLPRIANLLFAIFLPILHVIYAVIQDVDRNNTIAIVLDVLSFVFGVLVYWILDIVWVITRQKVFSWSDLF